LRTYVLERSQWVPAPVAETFAFLSDASNLPSLTPPWLQFRFLSPLPSVMREGASLEYVLRVNGIPVRWRSRIADWRPGVAFTDEQLRGPHARWLHCHTFRAERGGTRLGDRLEYALSFDPLSRPVNAWYVRPLVERVFDHRGEVIAKRFRGARPW